MAAARPSRRATAPAFIGRRRPMWIRPMSRCTNAVRRRRGGGHGASIVRDRRDASARRRREMMVAVALCLHFWIGRTIQPTFLCTGGLLLISRVPPRAASSSRVVVRFGLVSRRAKRRQTQSRAGAVRSCPTSPTPSTRHPSRRIIPTLRRPRSPTPTTPPAPTRHEPLPLSPRP